MMSKSIATEKSPRIACYEIPAETWVQCVLLLGVAAVVRLVGNKQLDVVATAAFFLLCAVNAFNFLIPFVRPNTILGGAKLRTLILAFSTSLGLLVIH
jgi:hypothetical protein